MNQEHVGARNSSRTLEVDASLRILNETFTPGMVNTSSVDFLRIAGPVCEETIFTARGLSVELTADQVLRMRPGSIENVLFALLPLLLSQLCLTLARAEVGVFTPEHAKAVLERHNEYRRQEAAADMYQMHWNTSLQHRADAWIQGCDFKHENCLDAGENLFFTTAQGDDVFLQGMKAWHDEKSLWSYSSGNCKAACHYTQIIWSWTTTVGCSAKICPLLRTSNKVFKDALLFACYYYPRGNFMGHFPFSRGSPCSKCAGGDTCTDKLCVSSGPESRSAPDVVKSLNPRTPVRENLPVTSLRGFQSLVQTYVSQARKVPQSLTHDVKGIRRQQSLHIGAPNSTGIRFRKLTPDAAKDHHLNPARQAGRYSNSVMNTSSTPIGHRRKQHRPHTGLDRRITKTKNTEREDEIQSYRKETPLNFQQKQLQIQRKGKKRVAQIERRRQAEKEEQRQEEKERQRQEEKERQRQAEDERQRQAEDERQRQAEDERQRQEEKERQRQAEDDRQIQAEDERQRQTEDERQRQEEKERQRQAEDDRQIQAEDERQRQEEKERQRQAEDERQRQAEDERQRQEEKERQRQAENERQRQEEKERQRQAEDERQRQEEKERQRQEEKERQRQEEKERQIHNILTKEGQQPDEQGINRIDIVGETTTKGHIDQVQLSNFYQLSSAKLNERVESAFDQDTLQGQAVKWQDISTSKNRIERLPAVTNRNWHLSENSLQHVKSYPDKSRPSGKKWKPLEYSRNNQVLMHGPPRYKQRTNIISPPRRIRTKYSHDTSTSPSIETFVRVLSRAQIEKLEKEYRGQQQLVIFKNSPSQLEKPSEKTEKNLSTSNTTNRLKIVEHLNNNKRNESWNITLETADAKLNVNNLSVRNSVPERGDTLTPLAYSLTITQTEAEKDSGNRADLHQNRSKSGVGASNINIETRTRIVAKTHNSTTKDGREEAIKENHFGQLISESSSVPTKRTFSQSQGATSRRKTLYPGDTVTRRAMERTTPAPIATIVRVLSRSQLDKLEKKYKKGSGPVTFRASHTRQNNFNNEGDENLQSRYLYGMIDSGGKQTYNHMKTEDSVKLNSIGSGGSGKSKTSTRESIKLVNDSVSSEIKQYNNRNRNVDQMLNQPSGLKVKGAFGVSGRSFNGKTSEKMMRRRERAKWNLSRQRWRLRPSRAKPGSLRLRKPRPHHQKYITTGESGRTCKDGTPACRAWEWRCSRNRMVRLNCPLTCGTCGHGPKSRTHTPDRMNIYQNNRPARSEIRIGSTRKQEEPNRTTRQKQKHPYRKWETRNSKRSERLSLRSRTNHKSRRPSQVTKSPRRMRNRSGQPGKTTASEDVCQDRASHMQACRSWTQLGFCQMNTMGASQGLNLDASEFQVFQASTRSGHEPRWSRDSSCC
ncbi:hypothetical protein EGW08_009661 [Elysia chlorotica]|uniref:SCP domain-containing protein n=1 Tax=Elysia chlorotica TaxID=188477 RepID=A0A433TLX6_ELYCH|nr:hypothetical protein EGW08_009661 [Elysia chlorotica]